MDTRINNAMIKENQLWLLFDSIPTAALVSVVTGLFLAVVVRNGVSSAALMGWISALLLVTCIRLVLFGVYRRKRHRGVALDTESWIWLFVAFSLIAGAVWGSASWLLFVDRDVSAQFFLAFVLAGIATGAVSSLSYSLVAIYGFVLLVGLPIAFRFLSSSTPLADPIGLMILILISALLVNARRFNKDALANIRYKLEAVDREQSLKDAVARAEEANQAKSDFLAAMSHEMRTPLNAVLGMGELLLGTRLVGQQRRYAEVIRQSSKSLLSLVDDVLDFSRIEAGRMELEAGEFNLRDLVGGVVGMLAAQVERKELELVAHIAPAIPEILRGDAGRLSQVLLNLVGNAVKFTEKGEVLIRIEPLQMDEDKVLLSFEVRDTGIGIGPEARERIFDAFEQEEGSISRRFGGAGLGLAIVRRLIGLMGSGIHLESTPGEGARFHFDLWLERLPVESDAIWRPDPRLRDVRVLVSDDNAASREMLHTQLASWGMRVTAVANGKQAVDALREAGAQADQYRLVLLDFGLPDRDGVDLAIAIRRDPAIVDPAFVLFRPEYDLGYAQRARAVDLAEWVAKPVTRGLLYEAVLKVLGLDTVASDPQVADPVPAFVQTGKGCSPRVLCVEDHPVNQEYICEVLTGMGCRVDTAANGQAALDQLERTDYDLVFMDCHMPLMDGFETTRRLRLREGTGERRVPVVAVSADMTEGIREQCRVAGMDGYLSKPFSIKQIQELLQRWLNGEGISDLTLSLAQGTDHSAEVTDPDDAPVVDRSTLERIRSLQQPGKPDIVQKVVGLFLEISPGQFRSLKACIAAADPECLRRSAHALKSASMNLGVMRLAALCRELEESGRIGEMEQAISLLARGEREFDLAISALTAIQEAGGHD